MEDRFNADPNPEAQAAPAAGESQRHLGTRKVLSGTQVLAALVLEILLDLEPTHKDLRITHSKYAYSLQKMITRGRP